jgi:DNA-binding NtrC family response regulator
MTAGEPCRVLLVDDEVKFVGTVGKRLAMRGMEVAEAHRGEQALEVLEGRRVDVVLLDVKMPGMSGIETLREIKRRHPLLEVIMLTGHASLEVAVEGMELGAFDYLVKPVDFDALLYKIQDAHKRKSIQEAKIKTCEQ